MKSNQHIFCTLGSYVNNKKLAAKCVKKCASEMLFKVFANFEIARIWHLQQGGDISKLYGAFIKTTTCTIYCTGWLLYGGPGITKTKKFLWMIKAFETLVYYKCSLETDHAKFEGYSFKTDTSALQNVRENGVKISLK